MSLQLKGGNIVESNEENSLEGQDRRASDKKNADPWGNKDIEDNFYKVNYKEIRQEAKKEYGRSMRKVLRFTFIIIALVLLGVGAFVGRRYYMNAKALEGRDIADLVNSKESIIVNELDVSLSDSKELIDEVFFWRTDKKVEVHSNEDIAVIYLDGRQTGLNVHSDQYKLFGIRTGMSDKEALEATTYPCNEKDYYVVEEDMEQGKSNTIYYYNLKQNDCIALTVNKMTNTVQGITYIDNYQVFTAGNKNK